MQPVVVFVVSALISFVAVYAAIHFLRPVKVDQDAYVEEPSVRSPEGRSVQIRHLNAVPWYEAPKPPRLHRCWPQTDGWIHFDQVQRCACGAIRRNDFYGSRWFERNSR